MEWNKIPSAICIVNPGTVKLLAYIFFVKNSTFTEKYWDSGLVLENVLLIISGLGSPMWASDESFQFGSSLCLELETI